MKKTFSNIACFVLSLSLVFSLVTLCVSAESTDVCTIEESGYATLSEALAEAEDGDTIVLTADTAGSFDVEDMELTLDLNGHTLTLEPAIGSAGTTTNGARVLYGATLTVKNGTLKCGTLLNADNKPVKVGIANYGTLTLENVDFQVTDTVIYTVNNRGDLTLKGNTKIATGGAEGGWAITNDPYNAAGAGNAVLNVADPYVVVGDVQVELYGNTQNPDAKVELNISAGTFGKLVSDNQTVFEVEGNITGGSFASSVPEDYLADGYTPEANGDGTYGDSGIPKVAKIGDKEYTSLADAVADVPANGTETVITLLGDVENGTGVVVAAGQNVIIDFGGFTYEANEPLVGSTGTVTSGFQLLKGSEVTLKDGTLTSDTAKMLVQNYSDLTLENMNLVGVDGVTLYTLSNNFGDVTVTGDGDIIAADGAVAFDLWYGMFATYDDGVSVTFDKDYTGTVSGKVEYGAHSRVTEDTWTEKAALAIVSGTFDVSFVMTSEVEAANIEISGGLFTEKVDADYLADGYVSADEVDSNGYYTVVKNVPTADTLGSIVSLTLVAGAALVFLKRKKNVA